MAKKRTTKKNKHPGGTYVTFVLAPEHARKLEKLCKSQARSRAGVMRNLLIDHDEEQ